MADRLNPALWFRSTKHALPETIRQLPEDYVQHRMGEIELYPFQLEAVQRLGTVPNRLVGHDMGLGKTLIAIGLDNLYREYMPGGKTLIVAPLSVTWTWYEHLQKYGVSGVPVYVLDNKKRGLMREALQKGGPGYYITHWESLRYMPEYAEHRWYHVIADECHRAKNRKTKQTRALKKIPAHQKTAMSGTPADNKPDDLWSVLNWLYPQQYTSYWRFYDRYVQFKTGYQGYRVATGVKNIDELQEEIAPFFLRRLKTEVLTDLPSKFYSEVVVELTPNQRRAYETMREEMVAWIDTEMGDDSSPMIAQIAATKLLRLQQFALASMEVTEDGDYVMAAPSSKLSALMEIVEDTEQQIVVFTQFRGMANLVAEALSKAKVSHVVFTGETESADRAAAIQKFQAGKARVFVGTVGAGSVGITLTAASIVVFLDRAWNPSLNSQAEDRLHRIGQKEAVQVIDVIAEKTVDRKRNRDIRNKADILAVLLGDK